MCDIYFRPQQSVMASPQTQVDYPQSYRDEFIGYRLTNTAIAFIILETVFVFLRIWSRKFSRAPFGWEDVLVFSGLVFCIGLSVACICKYFPRLVSFNNSLAYFSSVCEVWRCWSPFRGTTAEQNSDRGEDISHRRTRFVLCLRQPSKISNPDLISQNLPSQMVSYRMLCCRRSLGTYTAGEHSNHHLAMHPSRSLVGPRIFTEWPLL